MTDMTIEQVRDELRRLASDGGFGQMADAIDAHLAKAAQPVEAVDDRKYSAKEMLQVADDLDDAQYWKAAEMLRFYASCGHPAHPGSTIEQAGEVAWTKKAAEFIEKKAQSYADEFGRDDMGSISFGAGRGADKMEEYWMSLIDLAEDFRKLGGKCQVPPDGWECSRAVGHDGPCAASPTASEDLPHGTKLYAQPRLTVPEGYRLVPVEPTEAMLVSGRNENLCCADDADRIYAAMIAAAPDGEVG